MTTDETQTAPEPPPSLNDLPRVGMVDIGPVPTGVQVMPVQLGDDAAGVMLRLETPQGTSVFFFDSPTAIQIAGLMGGAATPDVQRIETPEPKRLVLPPGAV